MIKAELTSYQWMKIEGPAAEISEVKELLKVVDSSAKFSRVFQRRHWDGVRKLYIDHGPNALVTKAGVIDWLGRKLYPKNVEVEFSGKIPKIPREDDWDDLPLELRDYQRESVEMVFERQTGLLHLATNAGKTLIAAAVLKGYRFATCLYLVHRAELFRQSHSYFEKMLGQEVGKICAGNDLNIRNVTVGMIGTVYARMNTVKEMQDYLEDVDVVIVDEAHRAASKMYRKVIEAMRTAAVRVGMSGTFPPEESYYGMLLKGNFGETLFRVTNEDLKVLGVSAPMRAVVVRGDWYVEGLAEEGRQLFLKKKDKEKKVFNPETKYWNLAYEKGILRNKSRTAFICTITKEIAQKKGVLVIVDRIEHGEEIFWSLVEKKSKNKIKYVFADSPERKEALEDFRHGKIDVLISSPILDEGIDISGIYYLVLASGGKSKRRLLQRIGRGLRKKTDRRELVVFDFYDDSVPLLERHTRERMSIYKKEGFPIKVCDGDDWKKEVDNG